MYEDIKNKMDDLAQDLAILSQRVERLDGYGKVFLRVSKGKSHLYAFDNSIFDIMEDGCFFMNIEEIESLITGEVETIACVMISKRYMERKK